MSRSNLKYVPRYLNLLDLLKEKSHFLFGPRQTGKSSMIARQLDGIPQIDLLETDTFLNLTRSPSQLSELIPPGEKYAVIDEIQKLPILLDEVHRLIEQRQINFLLTGSSARKLRRQGVNTLGGRARSRHLHPLSFCELGDDFDLDKSLGVGLIPSIYLSSSPREDLAAYVDDYLRHEIAAEGLTKNLPAFSRFLEVAALCNSEVLNYSNVSNDAQVAKTTVAEYFEVLKDTLIGRELPCWRQTTKRKAIAKSKFYFFDIGVVRHILQLAKLSQRSPDYGRAFETYIHHELSTYCDYHPTSSLHFWRSQGANPYEVDFILSEEIAIEVKAKEVVGKKDLRGIQALREEGLLKNYVMVYLGKETRFIDDNLVILPYIEFLDRLWAKASLSTLPLC